MQPQAPNGQPPQMPPVVPPVNQTVSDYSAPAAPTATGGLPATATDSDLIEKEWVDQAKQVLTSNPGNPFLQNQAFTKLKADYMQKRYGKTVKSAE